MMKLFKITPVFILFLLPNLFYGQVKTIKNFHDKKGEKCDSVNAETIHYLMYSDTLKKSGTIMITDLNGKLKSEIEYENMIEKLLNGKSVFYNDSGNIYLIKQYDRGKLDGKLISYYKTGQQKREDIYKQGEFVSGKCFSSKGEDTSYFEREVVPEFIGGTTKLHEFIAKNIVYPYEAIQDSISGKVFVHFTIEKDGSVSNVVVIKSIHPLLDEEAIRVVKSMPKWKSGSDDGEEVRVRFTLPISFKLN